MRQQRHKTQRGFTLIELLIVIALLLIIMLMIFFMFRSTQQLYQVAAERGEVFTQGRLALDRIEDDLAHILPNNATVEGALSKDLLMVSAAPNDWADYASYTTQRDTNGGKVPAIYQDTKFKINVESGASSKEVNGELEKIEPILAFMTNTEWWDPEKREYQAGLAQVVYYLKRRKDYQLLATNQNFRPGTAYLMRLIIPQGSQIRVIKGKTPDPVPVAREEDICGSVLSMRVWAVNHAAAAANASGSVGRGDKLPIFVELNDKSTKTDKSVKDRLRKGAVQGGGGSGPVGDVTQVSATPKYTYAFGSTAASNAANEQRVFTVGDYPVSIMIELTLANDGFEITDAGTMDGTTRTFRRVIALPAVEPPSAMPKSQIERLKQAD